MNRKESVEQMIYEKIMKTELYQSMMACGRYEGKMDVINTILDLREQVRAGSDPSELLHEEGFEPDYVFDLI